MFQDIQDKMYMIIFYRCKGDEGNLNDCPHEGFQEATYCQTHKDDEGVFCYTSGKLFKSFVYHS